MRCPYCQYPESKVIDKRETQEGINRRRRACQKCEQRFTTYEKVRVDFITVLKKDGRKEPFDKKKILKGIQIACEKGPVTEEQMNKIATDIEKRIKKKQIAFVKSKLIGDVVLTRLKKVDEMAYIRFASVYKTIENLKELKAEIKKIR